jgi:hypothetical protein
VIVGEVVDRRVISPAAPAAAAATQIRAWAKNAP